MPEQRLSEAESYIMSRFWQHGPMRTDQLSALVAEKGWKPTTLLTFLSRLVGKGMLQAQKQGKANLYTPLVTRQEYQQQEGTAFLNGVFGGSASSFMAAMADAGSINPADIAELRRWLDTQEVPDD